MTIAAVLGAILTGCPEFRGGDAPVQSRATPAGAAGFPTLASVPEKPAPPSTIGQRQARTSRLISDRTAAAEAAAAVAAAISPPPRRAVRPPPLTTTIRDAEAVGVIGFAGASTTLSPPDLSRIGGLATIALRSASHVRVVGHASAPGTGRTPYERAVATYRLSLERADAVAAALRRNGVPAERITVDAAGDTQPALPGSGPSARASNHRVEIFLEMP